MAQPVLIIDVMNTFLRAHAAFPQHSSVTGEQIGGVVGFLRMMQRFVREIQPSRVYLAWEGGGSSKRRALYDGYKLGNRPGKLNRFYGEDLPDTEQNKQTQIKQLLGILKTVPVCQLYVGGAEADDLVAYLVTGAHLRASQKVIVSDDKDFYQLLNDDTWMYSPGRKGYVKQGDVFERFGVTAGNFAIAKAIAGDPSDNIPGIKGAGFKTIAKRFPMLGLPQDVLLSDIIDYAASHRTDAKLYQQVFEEAATVKRNYKLVYLDGSMVPAGQQALIDARVTSYQPRADRITFIKHLATEGIGDFDVLAFFQAFDLVMLTR